MIRRLSEAAARFEERRRQEREAPRLHDDLPKLLSLELRLTELQSGAVIAGSTYLRRIVVERAPALFFIPCGDSHCQDGGHDLTHELMRRLRSGATEFTGEDRCNGQIGGAPCQRELSYVASARYSA